MGGLGLFFQWREYLERWFERERDQIFLWFPVFLGGGIAAWFQLPGPDAWSAFIVASLAISLLSLTISRGGRAGRALAIAGVVSAIGCALIWWRAEYLAAPTLARPAIVAMEARIDRVERLPARGLVRLTVKPVERHDLPPKIRINVQAIDAPDGLVRGTVIRVRARLMPPPSPAVPGAYDFARAAWFSGIGATGRGFAPVTIVAAGGSGAGDLRGRLAAHIQSRIAGSAGGIASALATGDRGAITDADTEALQRSGLAHLLSVSGLHVTAVTGAAMVIVLRLLALSPALALRLPLPVIAAGAGALAAVGYTLLTGSDVPTVRSCIAALLVLLALTLGREAITLRLVATGATFVLLLWPEALAGPSFQLSFAAVTAIIALHESPRAQRWFRRREEGVGPRVLRGLGVLLATGLAVELALMPIGMYHFHKQGLYGALANIVAIPLTTFIIMPLEVAALLFDAVGLGAPFWWGTDAALRLLLWIAHGAANAPGAIASLPAMPDGAFGLMVAGGLWLALWRSGCRWMGGAPIAVGAIWALSTPPPDLLVTGDGRHLAFRSANGNVALLRDRTGSYVRTTLGENSGAEDALGPISAAPDARCSLDLCMIDVASNVRRWRIVATRSPYFVPWPQMIAACEQADIVVSDRRLPAACAPKWLKLDRIGLQESGGVAIHFGSGRVTSVRHRTDHPWVSPPTVQPQSMSSKGG